MTAPATPLTANPSLRPETQFILNIALTLGRASDRKIVGVLALARRVYFEFLADCCIKHGDPRFAWDHAGAVTVAHEYEIRFWEKSCGT